MVHNEGREKRGVWGGGRGGEGEYRGMAHAYRRSPVRAARCSGPPHLRIRQPEQRRGLGAQQALLHGEDDGEAAGQRERHCGNQVRDGVPQGLPARGEREGGGERDGVEGE